ncbi:MAG: HAD family hydrolase [Actinomycetota bacterium]
MDESEPPYEALLLDYGGVLTTSVHGSFEAFCEREELDIRLFRQVLGSALMDASSPAARVEVGDLDPEGFDREMAALLSAGLGCEVRPDGLVSRLFQGVRTEPAMVDAVADIRSHGTTVVLVSNSWGGATYDPAVIDALFDSVIISGDVGVRKPDREIFELAAKRAGTTTDRCVFVDDLPLNCDGARAVGMRAIHHVEPGPTISVLRELFGGSRDHSRG